MGNAFNFLYQWFREFVPALKTECLIVGYGLMAVSACLALQCISSGLTGPRTNLFLHPGTDGPAFLAGAVLVVLAYTMKPVPKGES